MRISRQLPAVFAMAALAAACGGSDSGSSAGGTTVMTPRGEVAMNKEAYPVFPDADEGADPAVPAEEGGAGFTGEGWETNTDYDLIGDPRAVKGGVFRNVIYDFPGTLRVEGPESNTSFNYMMVGLVYESLLSIHPTTLDFIPALATHWQVSPDRMTYRFRLDPNARFADGEPVLADDVVATWDFMMDDGLQSPSNTLVFGKFNRPIAESPYIVRVDAKELNWRNFLYFSGMSIFPAHVLANVDGATYLRDYNTQILPGSGPYTIDASDIRRGTSVSIRRRVSGYWAEPSRRNVGLHNFDEIRSVVVRDQNLALEMFKRGDLDFYYVNISREWVEELNFDRVQRGMIQKRKIFNDAPQGFSGLALNTRRAPFDDIRVRQALAHLENRALMIEKLFFNEYLPLHSYYPGGIYENPDNPRMAYDPERALQLLADAGWSSRDAQGRLVRDGQPLVIEIQYASQSSEPFLTVYQEDLRRVGITVNLRLVTPETSFQLVMERDFQAASQAWGALLFPNPETSFHSTLADQKNNNNLTGFKNARVDELLVEYDREFDPERRVALIREIDGIVASQHHYVLGWYAPFERLAYWNKFGHPDGYLSRVGDYTDMVSLWWIDPEQEAQLNGAMRDASVQLPVGETDVHYWDEYGQRQAAEDTN